MGYSIGITAHQILHDRSDLRRPLAPLQGRRRARYPYLQIWRITLKVKLINLLDYWAYNVNLYELGLSNMSSFFGLILQEGELELTLQLHRISHL